MSGEKTKGDSGGGKGTTMVMEAKQFGPKSSPAAATAEAAAAGWIDGNESSARLNLKHEKRQSVKQQ